MKDERWRLWRERRLDAITLNSTWELEFKICNSTHPNFKVNYGEVPMILFEQVIFHLEAQEIKNPMLKQFANQSWDDKVMTNWSKQ